MKIKNVWNHHPANGVLQQPSSIGTPRFSPKAPLLPAIHDLRVKLVTVGWWLFNSPSQLEEICATKGIWWLGICTTKKQHLIYSQIGSSFPPNFRGWKFQKIFELPPPSFMIRGHENPMRFPAGYSNPNLVSGRYVRGGGGWLGSPAMNENHRCFMGILWFHSMNLQNLFPERVSSVFCMKRLESPRGKSKINQQQQQQQKLFVRLASKISIFVPSKILAKTDLNERLFGF